MYQLIFKLLKTIFYLLIFTSPSFSALNLENIEKNFTYETSEGIQNLFHDKINNNQIPKLVHFVWLGSTLPKKYLDNIKNLSKNLKYTAYLINIWTDSKNYKRVKSQVGFLDGVVVKNSQDVSCMNQLNRDIGTFWCKGIHKNFFKKYIKYFEKELMEEKNYGAASDLLRYWILEQQGGIYLDTDTILLMVPPLERISLNLTNLDFFVLNQMSIEVFYKRLKNLQKIKKLKNYPLSEEILPINASPAIIGSQPHHPIIQLVIMHVFHNYLKEAPGVKPRGYTTQKSGSMTTPILNLFLCLTEQSSIRMHQLENLFLFLEKGLENQKETVYVGNLKFRVDNDKTWLNSEKKKEIKHISHLKSSKISP